MQVDRLAVTTGKPKAAIVREALATGLKNYKVTPSKSAQAALDLIAWAEKEQITGPKERLLNSVLPHEITHTVFAHYFKQPVPRWADEGGAVLSEDEIESLIAQEFSRLKLS